MNRRVRLLAVIAAAVALAVVAVVVAVTRGTGPKAPTVPTTTAPSRAAEAPTLAVDGGRARIRVHVDSVERQGDLRVVFYEVENTGARPVDTTRLRAEVDDDQGRRFRQQPATADDTRGVLQPGEAGVITARSGSRRAPNRRSCTWPRRAANRSPWRSPSRR